MKYSTLNIGLNALLLCFEPRRFTLIRKLRNWVFFDLLIFGSLMAFYFENMSDKNIFTLPRAFWTDSDMQISDWMPLIYVNFPLWEFFSFRLCSSGQVFPLILIRQLLGTNLVFSFSPLTVTAYFMILPLWNYILPRYLPEIVVS